MTKIPTRDGFEDLLMAILKAGQKSVQDGLKIETIAGCVTALIAPAHVFDEMIERIVELEAQCDTMGTMLLEEGCDGVVHQCAVLEARIKELEAVATCDHGEDAAVEWIPAFKNAEIYRCGCGVLLNINNPIQAMTAEEICAAVRGEARIKELEEADV